MFRRIAIYSFIFSTLANFVQASSDLVINTTLEEYAETTESPKLMVCCGHNEYLAAYEPVPLNTQATINGKAYSVSKHPYCTDLDGKHDFHGHKGWYTVDCDSKLNPDVLGDLTQDETLSHVFKQEAYQLITTENPVHTVLTKEFYSRIAHSLKVGGPFISGTPFNPHERGLRMEDPNSVGHFWLVAADVDEDSLSKTMESSFRIKRNYADLMALQEKLLPLFKAVGFSELKLYESHSVLYRGLKMNGVLENPIYATHPVQVGSKTMTMGEYAAQGPHPEATKVDPYFGNVALGYIYLIAKK